jgi:hypothetical protein
MVWFPDDRYFLAEKNFIMIIGAVQALLAAWALLLSVTAETQPLIACELRRVGCTFFSAPTWSSAKSSSGSNLPARLSTFCFCCVVQLLCWVVRPTSTSRT